MFKANTTIFVERLEQNQGNVEFDLTIPYMAESRIREIAFVTIEKAPELLSLFVEAYAKLADHYATLEEMVERGKNAADRRRAVIILDEVPEYVKAKGIGNARSPMGSEDIREAIVQQDASYAILLDKIASYKATRELVYMKLKAIDMAYTAIKKIIDNQSNRILPIGGGTIPDGATAGHEVEESAGQTKIKGFGKPRY